MYRILAPVDNDVERGQRQAEFIAGLPHGGGEIEVTVTHALHGEEMDAPKAMKTPDRVESVKQLRETLEADDIEVNAAEIGQPPADEILALADDIDADLIVLGGRKQSPVGKIVFGSVSQEVMLNTDRPVVVTGGGGD